jgi:hypothetical protein
MDGHGIARHRSRKRADHALHNRLAVMDMRLGISYIGARSRTG